MDADKVEQDVEIQHMQREEEVEVAEQPSKGRASRGKKSTAKKGKQSAASKRKTKKQQQ